MNIEDCVGFVMNVKRIIFRKLAKMKIVSPQHAIKDIQGLVTSDLHLEASNMDMNVDICMTPLVLP